MTFEEWWKSTGVQFHDERVNASTALELAKAAWNASGGGYHALRIELEHLRAALKEEREACAKVCEERRIAVSYIDSDWDRAYNTALEEVADAIRAL
jgi:hypothetical protein